MAAAPHTRRPLALLVAACALLAENTLAVPSKDLRPLGTELTRPGDDLAAGSGVTASLSPPLGSSSGGGGSISSKGGSQVSLASHSLEFCAPGCPMLLVGDGMCNAACYVAACAFDNRDCKRWCSAGCRDVWVGDGQCDATCMHEACGNDGGDCTGVSDATPACSPDCPAWLLGDGLCDAQCDTAACGFDNGDCSEEASCSAGCPHEWVGDGRCDPACLTLECANDGGDCADACAPGCDRQRVGDGQCDRLCNTASCGWDAGDCFNRVTEQEAASGGLLEAALCPGASSREACAKEANCAWARPDPSEPRGCYLKNFLHKLPCNYAGSRTKKDCQRRRGLGFCEWFEDLGMCLNRWADLDWKKRAQKKIERKEKAAGLH